MLLMIGERIYFFVLAYLKDNNNVNREPKRKVR
jgi:hypothetical protein